MTKISRTDYARLYGPTRGDIVRLGDTSLLAAVQRDFTTYGDELTTGAGKVMRDGEGFSPTATYASGALDMVVQNATVIDPVIGIVKGDIGIRDGKVIGIGKAGNPDIMNGVDEPLRTGPHTTVVHGEQCIATAGAVEGHTHFLSPQQCDHALAGGTTTLIGMSLGPNFDTSCAGPNALGQLMRAADQYCLNFGFLGRGSSDAGALEASVAAGALGVKIHEDLGAAPAVIDQSLTVADRNDFAVHLHTDTINEFGFCEDTLAAIGGRAIHMYHVEGAGGGHSPDLLKVCGYENVVPSSTNPTNPFTPLTLDEGVPMTMLCHMLSYKIPEDVAFADCRIRPQTMAAEDILHDMGAISIFGSDSQGMGRLAENIAKCWQLASTMKDRTGPLPEEPLSGADNLRITRYIAKYTINPARAAGLDAYVGSLEPGKLADLVLWPRESFGIKPWLVIKSGQIVWSSMGDASGSLTISQPVLQRYSWGALGTAKSHLGVTFVSKLAIENDVRCKLGLQKDVCCIKNVRRIGKKDMLHNDALPTISVNPQTFEVYADGELLTCEPATNVPLNRRYLLR